MFDARLGYAGAVLAVTVVFVAGAFAAQAATCGATTGALQNYFEATGVGSCYATGSGQINHPSDLPFGPSSTLVYLDKTGEIGDPAEGSLIINSSLWSITPPSGYTNLVLLFQQSNSPREPDWAAFLLDSLAGTWGIFGSNKFGNFSSVTLSHAILYGQPIVTPLPGALILFGSAFGVLAGVFGRSRRLRAEV